MLPRNIDLTLNTLTGFYEGIEKGVTYQLTFSQMNDLKSFYIGAKMTDATIEAWYNSLDRFAKKDVKRLNIPPGEAFYPDQEYDS